MYLKMRGQKMSLFESYRPIL